METLSDILLIIGLLELLTVIVLSLIRKKRELRFIQLYAVSTIIFFVFLLVFPKFTADSFRRNVLFNMIMFWNLTVVYLYFLQVNHLERYRRYLIALFFIFTIILSYYWFGSPHQIGAFLPVSYGLENLLIVIPCFLYFYRVFHSDDIMDFKNDPDFILICGFVFFYGITFPFYIGYNTMYSVTPDLKQILNTISNTVTILLYITFIKAYLCSQAEAKSFSS